MPKVSHYFTCRIPWLNRCGEYTFVKNHVHKYIKSSEKSNGKVTFFIFFNSECPKLI